MAYNSTHSAAPDKTCLCCHSKPSITVWVQQHTQSPDSYSRQLPSTSPRHLVAPHLVVTSASIPSVRLLTLYSISSGTLGSSYSWSTALYAAATGPWGGGRGGSSSSSTRGSACNKHCGLMACTQQQQGLVTHARRMQQQQQEQRGGCGLVRCIRPHAMGADMAV
jgi:hypothetical protein